MRKRRRTKEAKGGGAEKIYLAREKQACFNMDTQQGRGGGGSRRGMERKKEEEEEERKKGQELY